MCSLVHFSLLSHGLGARLLDVYSGKDERLGSKIQQYIAASLNLILQILQV